MALIHQVASSFLPEKSVGRVAFSSEMCEDITGGAVGAGGLGPAEGTGFTVGTGSVTVMETPTSFSPFSPTNCTLYSHFSFDNFVMIAFPDLTRDLDAQI